MSQQTHLKAGNPGAAARGVGGGAYMTKSR